MTTAACNPREDAPSRRHACAHHGAVCFPQERLLHETLEKTHAAAAARAAAREAQFKSQLPDETQSGRNPVAIKSQSGRNQFAIKSQLPDETAHELSVSERSLAAAQVRDTDGR